MKENEGDVNHPDLERLEKKLDEVLEVVRPLREFLPLLPQLKTMARFGTIFGKKS